VPYVPLARVYSNFQLSEVQTIFVRARLHEVLTKITVTYAGAKCYKVLGESDEADDFLALIPNLQWHVGER
jgi:hypothetical protein